MTATKIRDMKQIGPVGGAVEIADTAERWLLDPATGAVVDRDDVDWDIGEPGDDVQWVRPLGRFRVVNDMHTAFLPDGVVATNASDGYGAPAELDAGKEIDLWTLQA